jgi:hypothetical protein
LLDKKIINRDVQDKTKWKSIHGRRIFNDINSEYLKPTPNT